jgi:diguanylate cyclase (GGDEF)-like protein/PAS domain S-box-containing protein
VKAINSTVEILLIDNHQASSLLIERHIAQIKSDLMLKLSKIRNLNAVSNLITLKPPDIIFLVFNPAKTSDLSFLSRIKKANLHDLPIILFTPEIKIDFASLPFDLENYFILPEISPGILEKSIIFALKRFAQTKEAIFLKQENIELSSQLIKTKDLFQTIVDNTSTLVWMCDALGNTNFFNQAWSRLLGQENGIELDSNWMLNIHHQDLVDCQLQFNQALMTATGFTISYRLETSQDKYIWISNHAVPQFSLQGEFQGLVGYCFDITSLKKTEQKLIQRAASDRLLAQITQKIHASLELDQILQTTVDEVKQFLLAEKIQINRVEETKKLKQLTLLFESRLLDSPLSCDISEPRQVPSNLFWQNYPQLLSGKSVSQDFQDASHRLLRLKKTEPAVTVGELIPPLPQACSTLLVPIIVEKKLWGLICIENCSLARQWNSEEIDLLERVALELAVAIKQAKLYRQLEEANRELQQLSIMDGLTPIANRRKFDQYIAAEWIRLAREQSPLSLILCDIDHFKLYNDTYGHPAGDRCLIEVAQAISKVIKRPTDLVARYGGEEFVLVLPQTPLLGAIHIAQQIRLQVQALKIPHLHSAVDLYVTISLGVSSCIPHPNFAFEVLVTAADQSLYQAKERGRNQAVECEIELY